jgi:hypothetical protein
MIYEQKTTIPSSVKVKKIKVADCIKCGSDDIKIEEYEDTFGFISTVKCKNCKNQTRVNSDEPFAVKSWNRENDISSVIRDKISLVERTKKEIVKLTTLKKKRNEIQCRRQEGSKNM